MKLFSTMLGRDMIGALEAVASPSERSEAQKLSARYPEDSALVAALF